MTSEYGILFWFHAGLIILAYTSPFWLPWEWVAIGALIVLLSAIIFRGCPLTTWQFGKDWDNSFWWHYLVKIFPKIPKKATTYFIRFAMPVILTAVAYGWQEVLRF